ncbi:MAG: type I-C CRISPR-associated protein Cas7/Csd2 [Bacteroidales bacterium]|jgi:CRISPR-associated protein Csd2|nr:type I-C CRISPR-associated protein Cas7/Csd2 [Bacteroidales bacterium]
MSELNNRYDFVYLFDVKDGNPNGDPDAGNLPRIDAETGMGLVTDVCLKRKVRNYVQVTKGLSDRYDIFIKEKAVLDSMVKKAYENDLVKECKDEAKQKSTAKMLLCDSYYDIRTFGAVIATKGKQDQVRGPVQMTFARSIEPITQMEHSITRMAVTREEDVAKEKTMGRKNTVPYGLYLCHGFVSANLARQTGFSEEDLQLFWDALKNMFDQDRSAARGLMSAQKLIVFKHNSILGNAPANKLFDLVRVKRTSEEVARDFSDYAVTINRDKLPEHVSVEELL